MGKLPKSMQNKKRKNRSLRVQGTSSIKGPATTNKAMNRQMRRRMQKQGLDGMEEIDAQRVIFQTGEDEDLVIDNPQVIKVNQQGMEVYQVIGSAKRIPRINFNIDSIPDDNVSVNGDMLSDESNDEGEIELNIEITKQDIQLVAMQTGVSPEVAENALKESNGDLAQAIINLKTR